MNISIIHTRKHADIMANNIKTAKTSFCFMVNYKRSLSLGRCPKLGVYSRGFEQTSTVPELLPQSGSFCIQGMYLHVSEILTCVSLSPLSFWLVEGEIRKTGTSNIEETSSTKQRNSSSCYR